MRLRCLVVASSFALALGHVASGHAADQPISGTSLRLERSGSRQKLTFVSKDPAFLFPLAGGPDDPTAHGLVVELFGGGPVGMQAALGAEAGLKWRASTDRYVFADPDAPHGGFALGRVVMRQGKLLKISAPGTGLAPPQGSIGIRISAGSTRSCALFSGAAVRKDVEGRFVGKNAPATVLTDCSDPQLRALTCADSAAPVCGGFCPPGSTCGTDIFSCFCISDSQPCGDTAPVCNGECPGGQQCGSVGGLPLPSCECLPIGGTPCWETSPTCDGLCPSGTSCFNVTFDIPGGGELTGCQCLTGPPVDPCGGCPAGFTCVYGPPFEEPFCIAFCDGPSGAPVCDGTCPGGATCVSTPGTCFCMAP